MVAVIEGGLVFYVRTDHIGRPVFATNGSGVKVWEASYLPFGGMHSSTGTVIGLRFPGQWFRQEAGLHQNWIRDYDPTLGRYVQADPQGLVAGFSLYGYANQSPGIYVDPNGENPILVAMAIGALSGLAFDFSYEMLLGKGCFTLKDAGISLAVGAVSGGGVGSLFKAAGKGWLENLGKVGLDNPKRPTYSIGRGSKLLRDRLGLRFESHPVKRWMPNWYSYPHFHFSKFGKNFGKRHLPVVEPIAAIAAIAAIFTPGCECNE